MPARSQGFKFLNAHHYSTVACSGFFIDKYIIFSLSKHIFISGGDLRYIQILPALKFTAIVIYAHITQKGGSKLKSPLDGLKLNEYKF